MNMHTPPDRVVPHNIEAEQAVLGAVLVDNDAFHRVSGFLEPEHFHEPIHRKTFEVINSMIRSGRGANPITIKSFLPEHEAISDDMTVGQYIAHLAVSAVGTSTVREYATAVHEMWIRREAIKACEDVVGVAFDLPPDKDILTEIAPLEDNLARLRAERIRGQDGKGAGESYLEALSQSFKRGEVRGVPIAMDEIAEVISEPCFEAGNLYGILSSSGEGKTSLTVQLMVHAMRKGHPVCFLSYDQSSNQVMRQMVAQEHDIEARRQRDAKLLSEKEFETCMGFAQWVRAQAFEVIKCTDQSAPQLVGLARTFVKRRGNGKVPFVVVDHIGVVKPEDRRADEGTKAKGIGQILKAGAEMTDAAWLVLNQRNSFGMRRDNPRPISMDLFGGDPAKTPFDAIFYLYRFLRFLEERKAVASSDSDWKKIDKVFPSAVRNDGIDIAEIGAIKVRFGSPHVRQRLIFDARLTRYKSDRAPQEQESFGGL